MVMAIIDLDSANGYTKEAATSENTTALQFTGMLAHNTSRLLLMVFQLSSSRLSSIQVEYDLLKAFFVRYSLPFSPQTNCLIDEWELTENLTSGSIGNSLNSSSVTPKNFRKGL